ncbi:hypothetical protein AJ79_07400 [Helicocarpus griseus UAMH5409]|uniref:DNA polymerase delta subunit 3 n=1 Tax=Helicocarpus griseus UAMH5409 TaxID=1447875 RepID=A0A2B7X3J6_9EURO|nr:hypothetical protein AJ79_07400 [Helicocarpus griseus UAMH5409]
MVPNYKKYLAEKVISEQEIVTYRSLSRALKVHSGLAKRMLYDFHRVENAKKPQSVSATYLITGTQIPAQRQALNGHVKDGDDDVMQSSPFMSSQLAQQEEDADEDSPPVTSIILVREEDLSEAKTQFRTISAIFVHSVQPTRLQDLNVLSDIGHDTLESHPEDPLEYGGQCGMILNKNVKRRSGLPPAPPPVPTETTRKPAAPKAAEASKITSKKEESVQPQSKNNPAAQASSRPSSRVSSQGSTIEKPSSLKRDSSSIFKAFAKSKPKAQKETPEISSGPEEPSAPGDVVLDDESEEEREDLFLDTGTRSSNSKRESKKEREEKLRKMMEDEEMTDAPELPEAEESEPAETPQTEEPPKAEPEEQESPAPKGRMRGRRQVMKKKTMKDEDGYLVTKEEPVWESFSEDEVAPVKKKPAVSVNPKPGKGGQKTGQGSIMSFFGKK